MPRDNPSWQVSGVIGGFLFQVLLLQVPGYPSMPGVNEMGGLKMVETFETSFLFVVGAEPVVQAHCLISLFMIREIQDYYGSRISTGS